VLEWTGATSGIVAEKNVQSVTEPKIVALEKTLRIFFLFSIFAQEPDR
jgi:hypothetical protein